MKILFIITKGNNIGGAQIYVRDLAIACKKDGHHVTVAVGIKGDLCDQLSTHGIESVIIKNLVVPISPFKDIFALFEIKQLLQKFKPDVVSINSSKAGIVGRLACYFTKTPNVFVVHGWSYTPGISYLKILVFKIIEKCLVPFSHYWICVSMFDYNFGITHKTLKKDKSRLIYNGISESLKNIPKKKTVNDIPVLVMVARHDHQKDHKTLFHALKNIDNIKVLLIGDGPLMQQNINLANELKIENKVSFMGYRNDVKQILDNADLFALISNWEGFPLSTLEAMSFSLPVLVSNVGGAAEAVKENISGYIIPRQNHALLAEKIKQLCDIGTANNRKTLGDNARKMFLENYTFEIMYKKTMSIFKEVALNKPN